MDITQGLLNLLPQAGLSGIVAIALVVVFNKGVTHYEAEIEYLRAKNAEHEKRIADLEQQIIDILRGVQQRAA